MSINIHPTANKKQVEPQACWKILPFGELAEFKNGLNYKSNEKGKPSRVLGVGDFQTRSVLSDMSILSAVHLNRNLSNDEILQDGDLVFVRSNGNKELVGRCLLMYPGQEKVGYSGFTIRARLQSNITSPKFISLLMQNGLLKKALKREGAGTNISNLNQGILQRLEIHVPPSDEQAAIADLLSTWDTAIEKTERLIAAKQEYRRGLVQQLLSGKRRFPCFIESTDTHKTRWGEYPVDWDYPCIGEIAEEISMKNKDGTTLPVLSCTKHHGLVDSLKYFGKQVFSKNLSTYKIARRGQFVYATNHIEEGSIGYQDLYDEAVISPMYTVFQTGARANDRFIFLLLKTELYRHVFEANTSASVDRRGSLRWKDFSRIQIPLPSMKEQKDIVHVFDAVDRELDLLQQQLNAVKEQKKGLMQQLLTGKARVKIAKKDVA